MQSSCQTYVRYIKKRSENPPSPLFPRGQANEAPSRPSSPSFIVVVYIDRSSSIQPATTIAAAAAARIIAASEIFTDFVFRLYIYRESFAWSPQTEKRVMDNRVFSYG